MDNIKTCEEYVLNELNKKKEQLDAAIKEVNQLKEENEKLKNRISVFGELIDILEHMLPKENGIIMSDLRNVKVRLHDDPCISPDECNCVISFNIDKVREVK